MQDVEFYLSNFKKQSINSGSNINNSHISFAARIKQYNSDKTIRSILIEALRQNDLKGFAICSSTPRDMTIDIKLKHKEIIKEATRISAVTYINGSLRKKLRKYLMDVSKFNSSSRELAILPQLATGEQNYVIIIGNSNNLGQRSIRGESIIVAALKRMTWFESAQGASRTLLVVLW